MNLKEKLAENQNNLILNSDVLDGLAQLDNDIIDLIVTSPPYNVSIDYSHWNDSLPMDEYYLWCTKWLQECYRVLKPTGRIAINVPFEINAKGHGGRMFISADYWHLMKSVGFNFFGLVRLKELSSERCLTSWGSWLSPSCPHIYNAEECVILAYKENYKKEKCKSKLDKNEFIEIVSAEWNYRAETKGLTKANFSLDLPTKAIKILSDEDDIVMDVFSGSGTTAVACINTKRNFIGFEISPDYYKIAKDRIQYAIDLKSQPLKNFIDE